MKARRVVNKLLETDEIPDPKAYAIQTEQPTDLMRHTLRDELVERGWRRIRISPGDDNEWTIFAGYIDSDHRARWLEAGARVAPPPEEAPDMRMKLMRLFKAAARRAGMQIESAKIESIRNAYLDGFDLYSEFQDFEDDPGDWDVEIVFKWKPVGKFWSKASQATGYK